MRRCLRLSFSHGFPCQSLTSRRFNLPDFPWYFSELAEKRRREAAGGFSHQPFPSPSSSLNASSTRNASSGGGTVANGWGGLDGFERPFFMRVIETLTMLAPALAERRAAALAEAGVAPSSSPSSSSYGLSSAAGSFRGNNGYGRGLGLGDTGADGEAAALVTAFSSSYSNSNSVGAHGGAPPKQRIPPLEVAAQALSNDHNARVKAEQQQLRMAHPGEEDVVVSKDAPVRSLRHYLRRLCTVWPVFAPAFVTKPALLLSDVAPPPLLSGVRSPNLSSLPLPIPPSLS